MNPPLTPSPPGVIVSITTSGTSTAGKTYSLECSATVTGSADQPTIIWLHDGDEITPNDTTRMAFPTTLRSSSIYFCIIRFYPLLTSHAGTYTCTATVESVVESTTVVVTLQSECLLQVL